MVVPAMRAELRFSCSQAFGSAANSLQHEARISAMQKCLFVVMINTFLSILNFRNNAGRTDALIIIPEYCKNTKPEFEDYLSCAVLAGLWPFQVRICGPFSVVILLKSFAKLRLGIYYYEG